MITISDCNLCALLDLIDTDVSTENLLSQLSRILCSNLKKATSLDEAIESNNAGLPVDMYQDSRTKKTWTNLAKVADPLPPPRPNTSNDTIDKKPQVQALYKSPHLVVCRLQNGAMNYFVTIPPPSESPRAAMFLPGMKLPLPSVSQSPGFSQQISSESNKSTCKLPIKKGGKKGKEKAVSTSKPGKLGNSVCDVFSQLLGFLKPSVTAQSIENASDTLTTELSDVSQIAAQEMVNDSQSTKSIKCVEEEASFESNRCSSAYCDSILHSSCADAVEIPMDDLAANNAGRANSVIPSLLNSDVNISGGMDQNFTAEREEDMLISNSSKGLFSFVVDGDPHISLPHPEHLFQSVASLDKHSNQVNPQETHLRRDMPMERDGFEGMSLDLNSESVRQLLQLSQEPTVVAQPLLFDSPLSPLSQLMSNLDSMESIASPQTQPQSRPSTNAPMHLGPAQPWAQVPSSECCHQTVMNGSVSASNVYEITPSGTHNHSNSTVNTGSHSHAQSFLPRTLPLQRNAHSPQDGVYNTNPLLTVISSQSTSSNHTPSHSSSNSTIPLESHDVFSQTNSHFPNFNSDIFCPSSDVSVSLASDPVCSQLYPAQTTLTNSLDHYLFDGYITSAHECHDLESLVSTFIAPSLTEDHSVSLPINCNSSYKLNTEVQDIQSNCLSNISSFSSENSITPMYNSPVSLVPLEQRHPPSNSPVPPESIEQGHHLSNRAVSPGSIEQTRYLRNGPVSPGFLKQTQHLSIPNLDSYTQTLSYNNGPCPSCSSAYNCTTHGSESPFHVVENGYSSSLSSPSCKCSPNLGPPSSLSSPSCRASASSPITLQDIPEGSQIELEDTLSIQQLETYDSIGSSRSIPSSPGQASISSQSSMSVNDIYDSRSPSVLELCELLSESANVHQSDFSHLTLSGELKLASVSIIHMHT